MKVEDLQSAVPSEEEPAPEAVRTPDREDIFAEMRPYMVDFEDLDDTREAVYTRKANDPA